MRRNQDVGLHQTVLLRIRGRHQSGSCETPLQADDKS